MILEIIIAVFGCLIVFELKNIVIELRYSNILKEKETNKK